MATQRTQTIDGVTSTGAPSDLDALDAMAAQVDADHTGTLPDGTAIADQPAPIDYTTEAAATVDTFAALIGGYCPAAGELWDQERKRAVSMALAPVMEKYGFSLGALPPEITLIIVAGPLLYQTSKIVAAQMAQDKAKAKPAAQVTQAAPAQPGDLGTPEVARHPQTSLYQ
jgi:hypothetical protein